MTKVIKRNGSVEPFIYEKIVTSILKAGADLEIARKVADNIQAGIEERDEVKSAEIREMVLSRLKEKNKKWHDNWIKYDRFAKGK
ncbi:MAG: ATP cone domain containing protein [Candidatus Methanohalarchaeum thermophilum]|uniref:ATP cone domain containing protein n=1 Tax=Methanohalarchaeum thermophilum TaxID=1903181 RepID=A0A1Q6DW90_METT1|nr:MAG: ATP cone domain containing protein [Candidatus Methanohalarchaeum thermophilum]